jgi:integrase
VRVEWQLQRVGDQLIRRRTKTETSDATLPLPAICSVALRDHLAGRDRLRDAAGSTGQEAGYVFTTRFGTPIEPRNFNRWWNRRCDAAKVRRITVHDARRTCASLLADLDVHPRVAMQILRHGQFAITMEIYTQMSSKATREALRRLGESLG